MAAAGRARAGGRDAPRQGRACADLARRLSPARRRCDGGCARPDRRVAGGAGRIDPRSEEHTSELQSLMRNSYAVFCLKKKRQYKRSEVNTTQYLNSNIT